MGIFMGYVSLPEGNPDVILVSEKNKYIFPFVDMGPMGQKWIAGLKVWRNDLKI